MASPQLCEDAADKDARYRPPGPGSSARDPSLARRVASLIRNPMEAWPRAVYEERVWKAPIGGVFLMDPQAIGAMLVEHSDAFGHGALFRRLFSPVWGKGILTAEGPEWRWQRRAAAPAFRAAQMAALAPRMRIAAETALRRWQVAPEDSIFDIAEDAATIAFDVLMETLLSGGEDFDRASARRRIEAFMGQLARMRPSYFLAPDSYHEKRGLASSAEAQALRDDVDRMIRRRRDAPPRGDLVDLLMAAADPETGRPMDDAILRDNILGFIVGGHETSAVALSWSLYLASEHRATGDRLRAEVEQVTGGAPIEAEHVERLVFTRQVILEAMRLYPPGHTLVRIASRTMDIAGTTIRAGTRVIVPIYALHRHRMWWTDPEVFDPDRFAPGVAPPDRHVYLPFGAGPRICLGAAFAMTELVVVLATLMRDARFGLVAGHRVWPIAGLALRPEGGLPMRVGVRRGD